MGRIINEVDHGERTVDGVQVHVWEAVWNEGGSSFSVYRVRDDFDLTEAVNGECFDSLPTTAEIAELLRQAPPVRGVVTLTVVLELPRRLPTEAEYHDGGGARFLELIEQGKGDVLFAAAEPGVTDYAHRLGAQTVAGVVPSEWASRS